jgi:hypothetical protein
MITENLTLFIIYVCVITLPTCFILIYNYGKQKGYMSAIEDYNRDIREDYDNEY